MSDLAIGLSNGRGGAHAIAATVVKTRSSHRTKSEHPARYSNRPLQPRLAQTEEERALYLTNKARVNT